MPRPVCPCPPPLQRLPGHPEFFPLIQQTSVSSSRPLQPSAPSGTPPLPHRVNQRSSNPTIRAAVYISLYVDVNTFNGGRQPQNKLMRLRTFKTTRRPANIKPARRARVKTGTASNELATPWCATPADDHTHEQNRTSRVYHHATDQPTLTNCTEPFNNRPTNHNDLLQTPGPPGERQLNRVRRHDCAPRHASPVARASSSRLMPTENQNRWGCLQDRAYGLAPGHWAPESGG